MVYFQNKIIIVEKSNSILKCHLASSTPAGTAVCGGIGNEDQVKSREAIGAWGARRRFSPAQLTESQRKETPPN